MIAGDLVEVEGAPDPASAEREFLGREQRFVRILRRSVETHHDALGNCGRDLHICVEFRELGGSKRTRGEGIASFDRGTEIETPGNADTAVDARFLHARKFDPGACDVQPVALEGCSVDLLLALPVAQRSMSDDRQSTALGEREGDVGDQLTRLAVLVGPEKLAERTRARGGRG